MESSESCNLGRNTTMKRKIWRYKMSRQEERLWKMEEMMGWRKAMEACVEDDAREEGCQSYIIYDSRDSVISKGDVTKLAEPVPV